MNESEEGFSTKNAGIRAFLVLDPLIIYDDDGRLKMYDQKGRHKRTFREDNGGRMKMYDPKGRFEGTVRQHDDGGRMKIYDRKGRYQGYIKDDRVYDRDGTLVHRIVPDKNNKKKRFLVTR